VYTVGRVGCVVAVTLAALGAAVHHDSAQAPVVIASDDDLARRLPELTSWGRWSVQDELGTLNYLTPERTRAAQRLVRDGVSVSLARPIVLVTSSSFAPARGPRTPRATAIRRVCRG
jgi:hypothetical protein